MSSINSASSYLAASATGSSGSATDSVTNNSSSTLTQSDFLQLLVAQMQNQDPMNPQSDTEMASQMAQFTSLTQSSAMSSSLSMMQANSLVGSTVTVQTNPNDTTQTTSGAVQGVVMQGGAPEIMVNGTLYALSQVVSVAPTVAAATTSNSQN